jgi:hypothetical protein
MATKEDGEEASEQEYGLSSMFNFMRIKLCQI